MKTAFVVCLILSSVQLAAQKIINHEIEAEGNVQLTADIAVPKINNGYTLWLPEEGKITGMIVFIHSRRDTNPDSIINYALSKQLAVLYATTDNRLEFFFDETKVQEIESYIHEVVSTYQIPGDNLLYCGMSLEGTRALKLAIYGQSDASRHKIVPTAIAICDAPLDMVRFHKEMVKAKMIKFNPITANEGKWVSGYLEENLGGTPADTISAYINYSPYCYADDDNANTHMLKNIAVRCYTEPDVNWWIETRRKDYYAMNAIDLAALVNTLKIIGNDQAELITTQDKGYFPDGTRHPHTWNIIDEQELVDWFNSLNK